MKLAAVVIGRNEGDRLIRCLASLKGHAHPVIYVDSGSTDGSVAAAHARGAEVVELDMSRPFTAARARNAGLCCLKDLSDTDYVQVIDGDCELYPGWSGAALSFLKNHGDVAVVSGRLRERFPEATIWNRLADAEWDLPVGETHSVGGIAVLRKSAVDAVGGYRESLIAGEEPELCLRLKREGWRIWRLDTDMALHDIAMTRLSQWWRRARRNGHSIAEGAFLHGRGPEGFRRSQTRRSLALGAGVPLLAGVGAIFSPLALLVLLVWPAQVLRLKMRGATWVNAFFLTLGRIPEAQGILGFHLGRLKAAERQIIEYK